MCKLQGEEIMFDILSHLDDNKKIVGFYRDMYYNYKRNIGKITINKMEITEKMVENIKKRMDELVERQMY